MDPTSPVERALFGGAFSLDIPPRFSDVSGVRQIPDNQEVFVDQNTDQSVIIEILEQVDSATDGDAAKFHFGVLAEDNGAPDSIVEGGLPMTESGESLRTVSWGIQKVSKFNESKQEANHVRVFVAVWRIKSVRTDIVLSYNAPTEISPGSSSAEAVDPAYMALMQPAIVSGLFLKMIESFRIRDMGIFG